MIAENLYHSLLEWPLLQISVFFALGTLCYDLFLKYAYSSIKKWIDDELNEIVDAYQKRDENRKLRELEEKEYEEQAEKIQKLIEKFSVWENGIKQRELDTKIEQDKIFQNFKNKKDLINNMLKEREDKKLLLDACINDLLSKFSCSDNFDKRSLLDKALETINLKNKE